MIAVVGGAALVIATFVSLSPERSRRAAEMMGYGIYVLAVIVIVSRIVAYLRRCP